MQSKSLLALAAFATCCYAQASATASINSIAKDTADLVTLIGGISSDTVSSDIEEVSRTAKFMDAFRPSSSFS
jgi:hypothetical protein